MTIVESIKCVLQQNNDGLTSKQIYDEIIRQGLYSFGAENPVGVVNAQLRRRCIGLDFPTAYPIKFFEIAGYEGKKIKFRLISTENTATIITAPKTTDISELLPEEKIKAALQEHLQNIRQQVFDELDEILAANQRILTEIQNAEGKRGTSSSLSNLRTRQSDIDAIRAKLRARCEKLREEIAAFEAEKVEKEKQRQELDKSYEKLNQEKNDILKEQQKNRGEIDVKITSILGIIKSPYLLSESLCARMFELGNSMKKLKLPKTIAKDFFTELASADRCVCDRCIGERERTAILKRADQYLGSDQQSVLNAVKSSLMDSVYDERLKKAFEELEELRAQANRLDTRFKTNEEKLIKAGGEKARELQERIEELIRLISIARDELERIESKDENDASLTEENNLHKADQKFKYYEQEIAKATRTNTALRKKELVDSLVNEIKLQATTALKQEIVRKTNEKLRRVIVDDYVEIESIDRYIKLKGRDGASEGQTLSIAYCFLGTLFEDSELEFPFIIDSPTGKMDFEKRQAVADIIPLVFNQMIAFVQSAEVERFADRFYANPDSQYLTVVASPQDQAVVVYEGIDFFDSYQREHKGDEK